MSTFSSSILNEILLSIDRDCDRDPRPVPQPLTDGRTLAQLLDQDRKMFSLRRRYRHVWKRIEKSALPPVVSAATDEDPDSLFSTTSASSSDSGFSLTPSGAEKLTPSFDPSSKPKASCFGPFRLPKPVRATNSDQVEDKSSPRALKIYSQLKSLKQVISPVAKYINSLTSKKKKTKSTDSVESDSIEARNRKLRAIPVPERKCKSEQASPEWSFSSSSLKANGSSAIAADNKRCEELRRLESGGEIGGTDEVDVNGKVWEEVALDLFDNVDGDDKKDDDWSCSSSDLFEIDHLSL